jgi:hypothetical protein
MAFTSNVLYKCHFGLNLITVVITYFGRRRPGMYCTSAHVGFTVNILDNMAAVLVPFVAYSLSWTNSMEQSPYREGNIHSASQEIPRLLWKPKFHYSVCKNRPLVPTLSQMNPVHILTPCLFEIHWHFTSHLRLGLASDFSVQVTRPKFCVNFPPLPCVLHVPPTSPSLICSP